MKPSKPPHRISDKVHHVDITGYALPWIAGHPVLIQAIGSSDFYIAVFSTLEKLVSYMTKAAMPYESVKRILDQDEFIAELPYRSPSGERLRLIVDPWVTEQNTHRFIEIFREDA